MLFYGQKKPNDQFGPSRPLLAARWRRSVFVSGVLCVLGTQVLLQGEVHRQPAQPILLLPAANRFPILVHPFPRMRRGRRGETECLIADPRLESWGKIRGNDERTSSGPLEDVETTTDVGAFHFWEKSCKRSRNIIDVKCAILGYPFKDV